MNKNLKLMSLLVTLLLCLSATAFSQGTSGIIDGTISDQTGAVIPGASVKIESTGSTTGLNRTLMTDNDGYFVARVAPGTYRVVVEKSGFKTIAKNVTVVVDKSATTSVALEPGTGPITVDVIGDTSVTIDQGDTKIDTNITRQIIEALPKGTNFGSLLKIAPNVRPEVLGAGFQIDGASGAENVFVIDGQEVTNFRTGQLNANNNVPFELLQEVQIKSTGFEAEYGGATGGVINAVTAGGSNPWRGTFGMSFSPAKLQGRPNLVLNRYGSAAGQTEYFQPTKNGGVDTFPVASISGPVIKDRLWFSAVYAPQIFETTQDLSFFNSSNPATRTIIGSESYSSKQKSEYAFIRMDAQITSRLRWMGSFLWNPIALEGNLPGGGSVLSGIPAQTREQYARLGGRQNSNSFNNQLTWNPTNSFILNFRNGRSFQNEKLDGYGRVPQTRYLCSVSGNPAAVPGSNCVAGFNTGDNTVKGFDVSTRTTYDVDAGLYGVNFGGRHNFKFGYQLNKLFNDVNTGYVDTGYVVLYYGLPIDALGVPATPTAGNLGSGLFQRFGTKGSANSDNQAVFAQDSWNIGRLTLNLGIRLEKELVPSFGDAASTDNIEFNWGDKIAPRFGAAFDLLGDGKTKLFGSYGWFYDRFKYELPRGSFGGDFFRRDYFEILPGRGASFNSYTLANILGGRADAPGGTCPIVGGAGFSLCQFDFRIATNSTGADIFETGAVDPDIMAARQSEYTIGLEHQLGNNFVIAGRFTHKQIDRAVEDIGVFNAQGSEAYIIGNPGFGLVCDIATTANNPCPKAERNYDAVEVRLDKRSNKYFYNVSYTWSRLFGNYSGLASSDEFGRSSPNVNRFFDLPPLGFTANGEPDNGLLATDRTHVFKAYGGYSIDWRGSNINRTSISAYTSFQSGTPLTTIYNLYGLGTTVLYGRGDLGRTEMFSETDLSINHTYKFGRDARFSLIPYVDIRNLFDERNEIAFQTTISPTNFQGSTLVPFGCTTCNGATGGQRETNTFDTIFNGAGIQSAVDAFLTSNGVGTTGRFNSYGLANTFQGGRNIRFGFRFTF